MTEPVCVVGMGMIDGLGNNPSDCFQRMIDNVDYSVDLQELVEREEKIYRAITVDFETLQLPEIDPKIKRSLLKSQQLAFHVTDQALKDSRLPLSQNVAVVFSSISSSYETYCKTYDVLIGGKRENPRKMVNIIPDMAASHICTHYGFMGLSTSLSASCSTGLHTIDYAQRLCEEYDYVIVGCADANVCLERMLYFSYLGALGNQNCPFDDRREGFVMGEGAGCLVLQSVNKAKAYKSNVYAMLYPSGCASDAVDMTSPASDGRGAKLAMKKALQNANIEKVDAVSAHATSTIVGDPIEYKSIVDTLGQTPIYAPKSKIGHTIGSAGILEVIYAIQSMRYGVIPHCQNLSECSFDTHNSLVRTLTDYPDRGVLYTLNNSFAFGGKCVSQVIEVVV
jgi:3-oxoacyl-[acyl-carrier-protein] synthase II